LQRTYRRRIHDLSAAGIKLLAGSEVESIEELPQRLGINGALANDVTATIQNARLLEAKRVGRSLLASVLLTGISSAIAAVLWITVGGLAVLNTNVLMVILVLSVLVPFVIARALQMRMRRQFARQQNPPPQQTPASNCG
jgi:VIT1/CCC1 family predicted Fe2+/Mn2+ transporter